jgi:hypothetical protein
MFNFHHKKLPISFYDMWTSNRARNPDIVLRNADDLYVPAHHFATTKRFPFFAMPKVWNEANDLKLNPSVRIFLKSVKSALLNSIIV